MYMAIYKVVIDKINEKTPIIRPSFKKILKTSFFLAPNPLNIPIVFLLYKLNLQ